ncbi:TspO/MBR family protein [Nitzschia inconspicua]|uniref:TspO/MBR family protein n=1 Tax=Nitzschia inconspicua TaxID=303405 RepID=A0A9K3KIR1_9STRA|nr:TspO/MBR family protein [Nitzschia inconspicua]
MVSLLDFLAVTTLGLSSVLSSQTNPLSVVVSSFQPPLVLTARYSVNGASSLPFGKRIFIVRGGGIFSSKEETFEEDITSHLSESLAPTGGAFAAESSNSSPPVDYEAIGKWTIAYMGQLGLVYGFLWCLDKLVSRFNLPLPYYATIPFFYSFNLKTSIFSLLPNKKLKSQKMTQGDWEYNKRKKPSWTPPGFVFALMWPLFVFGLRATTAAMVLAKTGKFACLPIMVLMSHLSVGNLWNTVNNIERRLGPSVILLYALALTKAATAFAFYQVNPLAGKLLALTMIWLSAAAALETQTWRINPDPDTGKKETLYPARVTKWKTKFRWES